MSTLPALLLAALPLQDPFRVVMLPDTQHYCDSIDNYPQFVAQTQWIAANLAGLDIQFVAMVGDLVENGGEGAQMNQLEWDRAVGAMDLLDGDLNLQPDGLVPYAAVAGNHDYDVIDSKFSAQQYIAHFGPTRFAGRSWYIGASPNEVNLAQTFASADGTWLNLGLEWRPSDAALLWAQSVLEAHPGVPAIVTTHEHLLPGNPAVHSPGGETPNASSNNGGESVYRKLVEPYPQVFLVLCGHHQGNGRRQSTTALGREVHEVLADYQADPNGGNGWMQLLELRPGSSELEFTTFSPTYDDNTQGQDRSVDPASNFTLGFDLAAHRAYLEANEVLHFRQGQDAGFGAYAGCEDTHIGDGDAGVTLPDQPHGALDTLRIDADEDSEQTLLKFSDIVGQGLGRIPPGALVSRATLTLTSEGIGAESLNGATLHRMLLSWDDDATWDGLVDGVQLGTEADPAVEADSFGQVDTPGTDSFDVTASVQAWVDGAPNAGWVLIAGGDDRWELRSSEWTGIVERPLLTVVFTEACADPLTYCAGGPNSVGAGARIGSLGSTSISTDDFTLTTSANPPAQFGLFFYGPDQTQFPYGQGFLCVGPGGTGLFRFDPPNQLDGNGYAQRLVDFSQPPAGSGPGQITAGSTWYFQWWYRDPAGGGSGFNLSDGLAATFCP